MSSNISLNKLLIEKKLFLTLKEAELAIRLGYVQVNGIKIIKPSTLVKISSKISLKNICPYVSRGGLKLEKAIKDFKINVVGKTCLDIGASKGGFTDCLLQNGAKQVYALEKGRNLLGLRLQSNKKVKDMGGTDYKVIKDLDLPPFDIIVVDVSFASLEHIIPLLKPFSKKTTKLITLIKPRYETNNPDIINNTQFYKDIIEKLLSSQSLNNWHMTNITNSPILGKRRKALEFLALFERSKALGLRNKIEVAIQKALDLKNK